jgi:hypothetical protein
MNVAKPCKQCGARPLLTPKQRQVLHMKLLDALNGIPPDDHFQENFDRSHHEWDPLTVLDMVKYDIQVLVASDQGLCWVCREHVERTFLPERFPNR